MMSNTKEQNRTPRSPRSPGNYHRCPRVCKRAKAIPDHHKRVRHMCQVDSGKPTGMSQARAQYQSNSQGIHRTQIRTEGRTRHLAGHVALSRSHCFMRVIGEPGENAGLLV
jgi:hypothetical protein